MGYTIKMFNVFRKGKKKQEQMPADAFRIKYETFQNLLHGNNAVLELMADLEEKSSGDFLFDKNYISSVSESITLKVLSIITDLNRLSGDRYIALNDSYDMIMREVEGLFNRRSDIYGTDLVLMLDQVGAEMIQAAGGKMANIGEMKNRLSIPVPDGFVITAAAFRRFIEHHDLKNRLMESISHLDLKDANALESLSMGIQGQIVGLSLPNEITSAIDAAVDSLRMKSCSDLVVSVRSSAAAEDGHFSFAGQYSSYLNVMPDEIYHNYLKVLASLFTPRALYYAASKGFDYEDMVMAVGVMRMVPARSGGVLYSQDPTGQKDGVMIINAAWGLAKQVVDGTGRTDTFIVSRETGEVIEQSIAEKDMMIAGGQGNGVGPVPVDDSLKTVPCLDAGQIKSLARYASLLEQHFGKPQDIEWSVEADGSVVLLQSRPLRIYTHESRKPIPRRVEGYPVLIDKGVIASRGIGFGKAHIVRNDRDLDDFPDGGVLVSRTTSTKFVTVMERASAVITDVGGATGHMASLAREYHLPAILDTDIATRVLEQGQEVTVDAINCNVYGGKVDILLEYAEAKKEPLRETNLFHLLDRVMQHIVPLRLVDPEAENFRPESCTTLHDITRFCHEKAMSEMFGMSDTDEMERETTVTLAAGVPMDAHMIDVGGGIAPGVEKALPSDILSLPYISFLKGLQAMKWPEPRAADAKGFLGMMAHAASITEEQLMQTAVRSFAIVSSNYMNFSIRLGYHFSMVEAFAGETLNDNYLRFFFKGGGAAIDRRLRRVRLISELLEMLDFRVRVTEDVINASLLKFRQSDIEKRLEIMGRMTVFTKQLDMAMYNDDITDWYRDEFVRDHMQPFEINASGRL